MKIDVVYALASCCLCIVIDLLTDLRRNVLNEGSAQRDVEDLNPATDRERRNPARGGGAREGQLTLVAQVVRSAGRRVPRFAEVRRVYVFASGQHEALDRVEDGQGRVLRHRRHDEGDEPGSEDRVRVGPVDPHLFVAPSRL
jgi:hypothetical protein